MNTSRSMSRREKAVVLLLLFSALFLTGAAWKELFLSGPLAPALKEKNVILMWGELAAVFCLLLGALRLKKRKLRWGAAALIISSFLWLHRIFLPAAVSGLYFLWLYFFGKWQLVLFFSGNKGRVSSKTQKTSLCLLAGSSVWICFVCAMSFFGTGSISMLRMCAAVLMAVIILVELMERWKSIKRSKKNLTEAVLPEKEPGSFLESALLAFIFTMVLLQWGRVNITLDYDSLHYGLRTPYILNNGGGIYENLGNINLVYTYTKGLEVLVMPLSGTATYGYVLGFSMWTLSAILGWTYGFVSRHRNHFWGLAAAALLSAVPGVVNMGITAKTDCITLLFQLFMLEKGIEAVTALSREECVKSMMEALAFCLFTYGLKPTSLVFSTVLYGTFVLILLWKRKEKMGREGSGWKLRDCSFQLVILSEAVLLLLWRRTWLLTGYPVTSVFTGIWEYLGFHVKPPFAFGSVPDQGAGLGFLGGVKLVISRLYGMMACPVGEDMDHVIIAWGTWLIPWLLLFILLERLLLHKRKKEDTETNVLLTVLAVFSLLSLATLYMLWQVDGNYYMLYYALTVITAVMVLGRKSNDFSQRAWKKPTAILLAVLTVGAGFMVSVTNWSGVRGLTPAAVIHKGYYDHFEEAFMKKKEEGNEAIWNVLAADPAHRVLAFGEHPEVLSFPCNIQSYYDLTGSGGNVYMVKTLDNFKDFLRYAKTEYIYVEKDYLEEGSRAADIIRYMLEDGSLKDCIYENGNMLGKVDV